MLKKIVQCAVTFASLFCSQVDAKTSLTDDKSYPQFCHNAVKDPALFEKFKRVPVYSEIVENLSFKQGREQLDVIMKQSPEILDYLAFFKKNDLYGHPRTYFYPETETISPTTLRYIKVASDLKKMFGSLDDFTIVEIGGGYGGQCKILSDLFQFKNYIIIDLPGPLALAKKYLDLHNVKNVSFLAHSDDLSIDACDLAISNYAYSECTTEMQRKYLQKVLSPSKRGYLICNHGLNKIPSEKKFFSSLQEVLGAFSEFQIPWKKQPEHPLTYRNNYLLFWGES